MVRIAEAIETVDRRGIPQWLEVDRGLLERLVYLNIGLALVLGFIGVTLRRWSREG